jgi:hypothetical protein
LVGDPSSANNAARKLTKPLQTEDPGMNLPPRSNYQFRSQQKLEAGVFSAYGQVMPAQKVPQRFENCIKILVEGK